MSDLAERFRVTLQRQFLDNPNGLAIQFKNQAVTFRQLEESLFALRRELGSLRGVRILILLPDSLAAYVLYVHLFLEGAVIIPVSVRAVTERIHHVCARVFPHLVITDELLKKTHRQGPLGWPCGCLIVGTAGTSGMGWMNFRLANGKPWVALPTVPDEMGRFVIFTSGSTGVPKGVCLSESNILAAAEMLVQFLPLTPSTLSLVTVPLYDYYGMIQVFGHILGGAAYLFGFTGVLRQPLFATLYERSCTDLVLVPHTLRLLLAPPRDGVVAVSNSVQRITTSSDILTPEVLESLFAIHPDVTVVNVYGLTEAGRACYKPIQRHTPLSRSIRRPSPGVVVTIDGDKANPGEIVIRGPNVMLGYLTGIKDDQLEFKPADEMRTGDLGYFDERGEIVLAGRRDQMINLMGMKMHPEEIEMAALRVPGITEARAKLAVGPQGVKEIHMEAVCPDQLVTAEELIEKLRATLPRAFVPTRVDFVSSFPRTDIGAKILR